MVGLALLLQVEDRITDIDVLKGLIYHGLFVVCLHTDIRYEALLLLVVPRNDELVAGLPPLQVKLIEEASMLYDEHVLKSVSDELALFVLLLVTWHLALYHG